MTLATGERIGYADQSADALWFTLVKGELDMRQFDILTEASYNLPRERILRAGIIGASHFLSFESRGSRITEVFACMPEVRAKHSLERRSLQNVLEQGPVEQSRYGYRFEARSVPWKDGTGERDALLDQICSARGGDGEIGLLYTFPDPPNVQPEFVGSALTAVWAHVEGSRISVRTLHAYPSSTMVFTTSTGDIDR